MRTKKSCFEPLMVGIGTGMYMIIAIDLLCIGLLMSGTDVSSMFHTTIGVTIFLGFLICILKVLQVSETGRL